MSDEESEKRKPVLVFLGRGGENIMWNLISNGLWALGAIGISAVGLSAVAAWFPFGMYIVAFITGGLCNAAWRIFTVWGSARIRQQLLIEEWPARRSLLLNAQQAQIDAPCTLVLSLTVTNISPLGWIIQGGSATVSIGENNAVRLSVGVATIRASSTEGLVLHAVIPEPRGSERWLPAFIDVELNVLSLDGQRSAQVCYLALQTSVAARRAVRGVKALSQPVDQGSAEK